MGSNSDRLQLECSGSWATSRGGASRMIGLNSFSLDWQSNWEFGPAFGQTTQDLVKQMASISSA